MAGNWGFLSLLVAYLVAAIVALPSSLVEEIKNSELKSNKVKRAQPVSAPQENIGKMSYYNNKPTAIKRGTNLKESEFPEQPLYRDGFLDTVQSGLYNPLDEKALSDYEKGYRYGTNKDRLDEALENAVLKGDMYEDPYSMYRYYGPMERRRRRDTKSTKSRQKRNVDLTPEEVLALLSLYENNQRGMKESDNYRQPIYNKNYEPFELDNNGDETWLNAPVYPHVSADQLPDNYLFDYGNQQQQQQQQQQHEFKPRWGSFDEAKKKRLF